MDTCGCRYEPIIDPMGHCVGGNIIYCPTHAAAPDLYRITKMFYEWLSDQYNPSPMAINSLMDGAKETLDTLARLKKESKNGN